MISQVKKLLWVGFFGAVLMVFGLSAQANIIQIDSDSERATVKCSVENNLDAACLGVTDGGEATLSADFADLFGVSPVDEGTVTAFLNGLFENPVVDEKDAYRVDTGGADSFSFVTTATWFAIKAGVNTAFFKNEAGALDLAVTYAKADGKAGAGMGISNVTFWGGETTPVPEPGALALLGAGFLMLVFLMRRRHAL